MSFVKIPGGAYDLGWQPENLPSDVLHALREFVDLNELSARYSPRRTVKMTSFSISADCIKLRSLMEGAEEELESVSDIQSLCDVVEKLLLVQGLRLASEDEWEVAFGGSLFPWGARVPDGASYGSQTQFSGHLHPTKLGLSFNPSTYAVELSKGAFKLGDGGEAVCGSYPWPLTWMPLCISHRMVSSNVDGCLREFIEDAEVRLVQVD